MGRYGQMGVYGRMRMGGRTIEPQGVAFVCNVRGFVLRVLRRTKNGAGQRLLTKVPRHAGCVFVVQILYYVVQI
jgi:hypothetical protein